MSKKFVHEHPHAAAVRALIAAIDDPEESDDPGEDESLLREIRHELLNVRSDRLQDELIVTGLNVKITKRLRAIRAKKEGVNG